MDNIELFHNLVNLAAADGKFTPEEVEFLATRAEIWNISNDEFETAIAGISEGNVEVKIPESIHDRRQLMKEMIRLMAVDGELAEMEKTNLRDRFVSDGFYQPTVFGIVDRGNQRRMTLDSHRASRARWSSIMREILA